MEILVSKEFTGNPTTLCAHALDTLVGDIKNCNGELLGLLHSGVFGAITRQIELPNGETHQGLDPAYKVDVAGRDDWQCFVYESGATVLCDLVGTPGIAYHLFIDEA